MFAKIALRAKVLIGIAAACGGYVVLMPDGAQTIEPRRGGGAASIAAASSGGGAASIAAASSGGGAASITATSSGGGIASAGTASHVIKPGTGAHNPMIMSAFLQRADRVAEASDAGSLFAAQSWYTAPPAPPPPPPAAPLPPPPPTAPPLPFLYMGSYKAVGAGYTYFLTAGDRVYDVKIGDTLDDTYRVDGVKAGQLLLTYMPLKIQQSLAVGDE